MHLALCIALPSPQVMKPSIIFPSVQIEIYCHKLTSHFHTSLSDSACQTKVLPAECLLRSSSLVLQVRWWDVTVGKQDFRLAGHSDYVRSAAASPTSPDMWATAGYDHICKLWDVRSQECTMSLDHGAPIEDVKFFPSGEYQA